MDPDLVFAAGAAALVLTVAAVAVVVLRSNGRQRLERFAPAFELGTSRLIGPFAMTVEGLYRGYTCRYTIQPASQNNPGGASVRLFITGAPRWSAEVATAGTRLMVKVGLMQDLNIGEHDLDERLRFSAEDESVLRSTFAVESGID